MKQQFIGTIGNTQKVSFTSSSAATANAVTPSVNLIRVTATQDCFLVINSNPTATSSGMFLKAGETEYFRVAEGQKIAAIQDSAAGDLYVTEMS
jgi:hypothetical protein